jgi:hypothetical protein
MDLQLVQRELSQTNGDVSGTERPLGLVVVPVLSAHPKLATMACGETSVKLPVFFGLANRITAYAWK